MATLTVEHKKQIDKALDAIKAAEAEVKRATNAGIDVSDQKTRLADAKSKLLAIRNAYWPGGA